MSLEWWGHPAFLWDTPKCQQLPIFPSCWPGSSESLLLWGCGLESGTQGSPRNSPHSAGSLSLHPFVVNELPHPHLHCASLSVLESLMSLSRGATTRCRGWRRGLGPVHSLCTPSANPAVFSPSFRESHCLHFWTVVGFSVVNWLILYCFLVACRQLHISFLYSSRWEGAWVGIIFIPC